MDATETVTINIANIVVEKKIVKFKCISCHKGFIPDESRSYCVKIEIKNCLNEQIF